MWRQYITFVPIALFAQSIIRLSVIPLGYIFKRKDASSYPIPEKKISYFFLQEESITAEQKQG